MAKIILVGDERFLKNVSDGTRVLHEHGLSLDESEVAINRILNGEEVEIETENIGEANQLVTKLNEVIGIRASVKSESN